MGCRLSASWAWEHEQGDRRIDAYDVRDVGSAPCLVHSGAIGYTHDETLTTTIYRAALPPTGLPGAAPRSLAPGEAAELAFLGSRSCHASAAHPYSYDASVILPGGNGFVLPSPWAGRLDCFEAASLRVRSDYVHQPREADRNSGIDVSLDCPDRVEAGEHTQVVLQIMNSSSRSVTLTGADEIDLATYDDAPGDQEDRPLSRIRFLFHLASLGPLPGTSTTTVVLPWTAPARVPRDADGGMGLRVDVGVAGLKVAEARSELVAG